MTLKVWIPTEVMLSEEVTRIRAEAENGWFGILPRHIDFVTSLVPGILCFEKADGGTEYLAVDQGVLVKCGSEVSVSTRNAVRGTDPGTLHTAIETQFRKTREIEQAARVFESRLEADLVRQLLDLEKYA
jgi:F-type H+-transporting ATPase subunit epsilon